MSASPRLPLVIGQSTGIGQGEAARASTAVSKTSLLQPIHYTGYGRLSLHSSHSMLHSIDSCCGRRMTLVPVETIKGVVGSST